MALFLPLFQRDISLNSEHVKPIRADLVDRLHSLVRDLEADGDPPLPDDDTSI